MMTVTTAASKIDELYQKPLGEFTGARNALAKTLSAADAAEVRALAKPTVVAWALNQVYWRARKEFERALQSGERLREAQIAALKGKSADVRAASDAHRKAIADAVQKAVQLAEAEGSRPSVDELTRTLETLSLARELPEPPGRLTRALQPAGFEALAGVAPVAAPARSATAHRPEPRAKGEPPEDRKAAAARARADREEEARRAHERRAAQQEVDKAAVAVDRAQAAEAQARAAWERARQSVEDAKAALARVKAALRS
jgi:hypothetical protein